jgi:hypothetical protein
MVEHGNALAWARFAPMARLHDFQKEDRVSVGWMSRAGIWHTQRLQRVDFDNVCAVVLLSIIGAHRSVRCRIAPVVQPDVRADHFWPDRYSQFQSVSNEDAWACESSI